MSLDADQDFSMIATITIDGIDLSYWTNGFLPDRKSLVFIHSSGADHAIWENQFHFFEQRFNIFAPDLPGHGRSGGRGERDVFHYGDWIRKFIASLSIDRPVLIGLSLGAAICLTLAISESGLLSAIIPVGGGITMPVNPLILEGIQNNTEATKDLIWKFSVYKGNRERLAYFQERSLGAAAPGTVFGDFTACNHLNLANDIAKISLPILLVCGREDKMTPPFNCFMMKEKIPGAEVALVENAGHMVMLENPGAFNTALIDFLLKLKE